MPNLMERWFRELTENAVPPGAFCYGRHPLQASKGGMPEIFVTLLHDPLYARGQRSRTGAGPVLSPLVVNALPQTLVMRRPGRPQMNIR